MNIQNKAVTPETCFLFGELPAEDARKTVATLPPPVRFKKGDTVFTRAENEPALGILLSGSALVRRIGSDGKEQLCNRLFADSAFGAAALFSENEAVSHILADSGCTVQFIPQSELLALAKQYPSVCERLLRFFTDRIRFLNYSLNGLRGGTAAQRLFAFLKSKADENGTLTLPPISSLAATLSIGRTSIYRAFDELELAGFIRRDGKTVTLISYT